MRCSVERLCEGLGGGSIDGWSRSPAGASRGRYGEVVSAPPYGIQNRGLLDRDVVEGLCAGCHGSSLRCGRGRRIQGSRGFEVTAPSRTHAAAAQAHAGGVRGVAFDGNVTTVSGVLIGPTGSARAAVDGAAARPFERRSSEPTSDRQRSGRGGPLGCPVRTQARCKPPWQARLRRLNASRHGDPFGARRSGGTWSAQAAIKDR